MRKVQELQKGLACLRAGQFFDAHEYWEIPWKGMHGHVRSFWQAMIQLSVGAYHYQRHNPTGCRNLWRKARQRCEDILAQNLARDVQYVMALRELLNNCLERVESGENPLPEVQAFAAQTVSEDWFHFR